MEKVMMILERVKHQFIEVETRVDKILKFIDWPFFISFLILSSPVFMVSFDGVSGIRVTIDLLNIGILEMLGSASAQTIFSIARLVEELRPLLVLVTIGFFVLGGLVKSKAVNIAEEKLKTAYKIYFLAVAIYMSVVLVLAAFTQALSTGVGSYILLVLAMMMIGKIMEIDFMKTLPTIKPMENFDWMVCLALIVVWLDFATFKMDVIIKIPLMVGLTTVLFAQNFLTILFVLVLILAIAHFVIKYRPLTKKQWIASAVRIGFPLLTFITYMIAAIALFVAMETFAFPSLGFIVVIAFVGYYVFFYGKAIIENLKSEKE
ncbi:MAG: hypothetical protein ACK5LZ_06250 [Anaerorhabdus sp.]